MLNHFIGASITFEMELWDVNGTPFLSNYSSVVLRVIQDPLGIHETKCVVKINDEEYGIPLSEIHKCSLMIGKQLELF